MLASTSRTAVLAAAAAAAAPRRAQRHQQQVRHASFSWPSISSLFRRPAKGDEPSSTSLSAEASPPPESDKGLFDAALEDKTVAHEVIGDWRGKKATFHKSSTANFKTSKRKLNALGRLIAGRAVDEGVLQLQVAHKGQAPRLLSMLTLARDHAVAKGLSRENLVIAQAWVTQGPSLKRLDIKGRGRHGVKHHPSSRMHVLLAEGKTREVKRRERRMEQWRACVRGVAEGGSGVGVGPSRKIINAGLGGWRW